MPVRTMKISLLVPWRTDNGHRQRLWDWCRPRWEASGLELCVGVDDDGGPFNLNRALNRAREQATGEVLVITQADSIPDPDGIRDAVAGMTGEWAWPYRRRYTLTEDATEWILKGSLLCWPWDTDSDTGAAGVLAVRAETWDRLGGRDERFSGWGSEERAYLAVLRTMAGTPPRKGDRVLYDLWHPKEKHIAGRPNQKLKDRYVAAEGDPEAMCELLNERA